MDQISLVIILLAALVTPLVLARFNISVLPTAVVEILVGIVLGPSLLNLVHPDSVLTGLSNTGVIVLLFLSGLEIDFDLFKPKTKTPTDLELKNNAKAPKYSSVRLALYGYGTIMVLSLALGFMCQVTGLFKDPWLAAILFMTVSLGIVIATLKEKEILSTSIGQTILLISALGEVMPILGLTVYISIFGTDSKSLWLILILFAVAALVFFRFRKFFVYLDKFNKSTTQVDVRLAFFIIALLATIAVGVGSEAVLGAFVGGMVYKLLQPSPDTKEKLDSIGYGFFIPIFFMMSGVGLNLKQLLADPKTLVLIPIFLVSYWVAKALLYPIFRLRFDKKNSLAGTALISTTITMVLAILKVANDMKLITAQQSGAFLLAAILTCVAGPLVFNKMFTRSPEVYQEVKVNMFGANLVTIPVAQQLANSWYDITLFTDNEKNYKTLDNKAHVHLLKSLDADYLKQNGYFDADIAVFAYFDPDVNFTLAKVAKQYGVKRVIARFEERDILNAREKELTDLGVEVYNTFAVNVAMLREMIEVPSTFNMIKSNSTELHEVTLRNSKFAGMPIKDLPFSDDITIARIFRNRQMIHPVGTTILELNDRIIFAADKNISNQVRQEISMLN